MNRFVRSLAVGLVLLGLAAGLSTLVGCGGGSPTEKKVDKPKGDSRQGEPKKDEPKKDTPTADPKRAVPTADSRRAVPTAAKH
jgi:hypothetical protein